MDLVTGQGGMEVTAPDPALVGHIDPHWLWARATEFTGYLLKGDDRVRAVVELSSDEAANQRQREAFLGWAVDESIQVPPHHQLRLAVPGCTHFVARLPIADIEAGKFSSISRRIKPVFVGKGEPTTAPPPTAMPLPLDDTNMVAQIEVGNGQLVHEGIASSLAYAPYTFLHVPVFFDAVPLKHGNWLTGHVEGNLGQQSASALDEWNAPSVTEPPAVVVGIIDFGCPFAHAHFAEDAPGGEPGSRVRFLWDQGRMQAWRSPTGAHDSSQKLWSKPDDFGYGRETNAGRLKTLMARWLGQPSPVYGTTLQRHDALFEQACYACAGLPELLVNASHGAHVLDIAAGSGFAPSGCAPLSDDAAAHAPIVFVQLPEQAVRDLSGGWLDAYVIDGVHYIIDRARQIDPRARVVINLSFGSYAGPHDGSSLLEKALDDIAASQGVVMVLAAGNTPPVDKPIHAYGRLEKGSRASVNWHILSNDATQNFLELWGDTPDGSQPTLAVTMKPPDGQDLHVEGIGVSTQSPAAGWRSDVSPAMAAVCQRAVDPIATMALLAVGPTRLMDRDENTAQPATAGIWNITIENKGQVAADIHLWAERDEPGRVYRRLGAQSYLSSPADGAIQPSMSHTLTAQSCGEHTLVVGGTVLGATAWQVYGETASGPSRNGRRDGPDLAAPAARLVYQSAKPGSSSQLRGLAAAGNLSGVEIEMHGTSMAAPWVSRKVTAILADTSVTDRQSIRRAFLNKTLTGADDRRTGMGALMADGSFQPRQP